MAGAPPHRLATRRVYRGRLLEVDVDTVRAPDGSTMDLEMVRHPGAAAVVPFLSANEESPDPEVLLLEPYRYAAGGSLWEIPAGVLHPGEDPAVCARRELEEETGATAREMTPLTTIFTTPGFTDERIHLFLATGLTMGEPRHEKDEFIAVKALRLSRVLRMIRDGEMRDAKSIVGLLYAARYRARGEGRP